MRILIIVRPNAAEAPGGDTVLAGHAAESLRQRGVDVDLVASLDPDASGYDAAHIFGVFDPDVAEPQIDAVRRSTTPLVVSPIWWDRTPLFTLGPRLGRALGARDHRSVEKQIALLRLRETEFVRKAGRGARAHLARQAAALRRCDLALAGSNIEAFACARHLGVDTIPYVVAHYGLDDVSLNPGESDLQTGASRGGVVCVGRIEPLKNQAMLLFALRDLDVDITLVGSLRDVPYAALCRRLATKRTRFVERLSPDDLTALLGRTAVHALPSWGDLPGFVSLEAGARGARVVAGSRGSEREYLGADARFVDPLDAEGIRAAVVHALEAPERVPGDAFDLHVRTLRWDAYAQRSLGAYERVRALGSS